MEPVHYRTLLQIATSFHRKFPHLVPVLMRRRGGGSGWGSEHLAGIYFPALIMNLSFRCSRWEGIFKNGDLQKKGVYLVKCMVKACQLLGLGKKRLVQVENPYSTKIQFATNRIVFFFKIRRNLTQKLQLYTAVIKIFNLFSSWIPNRKSVYFKFPYQMFSQSRWRYVDETFQVPWKYLQVVPYQNIPTSSQLPRSIIYFFQYISYKKCV